MPILKGRTPKGMEEVISLDSDTHAQHTIFMNGTSLIDVTLSLDTNIYASGDVLADTQEIADALRVNGGTGIIQSLVVLDKDDLGLALDIVFLQKNVSIGTENSAVSISDTNAEEILGIVEILSGDYVDLVGSQIVTKQGLSILAKSLVDSKSLYVAAISRATGTYTAAGIVLKIGILRD